jgi:hypothetical protein
MICLINFSILPPNQSQEAPAMQSAALPHTAVLDTSGSCFAVLIIPLANSRTAAPPINPFHFIPAPHTPVSPPPLTLAAGTKYHRPHPQQSAGHSLLSGTHPPHQPAGYPGVLLSVATRPDQVEGINSWISGICKDYLGIIPLGAMHPEDPDPEAESMWMRQSGIKGMRLHSQMAQLKLRGIFGVFSGFNILFVCQALYVPLSFSIVFQCT